MRLQFSLSFYSSSAKGEQYPKVIKARDIFAVQIQRIQRAGQESGGHPKGVSIFVVRPKKGMVNGLTWEEITLESTNEGCCQEWFQALMKILNGEVFFFSFFIASEKILGNGGICYNFFSFIWQRTPRENKYIYIYTKQGGGRIENTGYAQLGCLGMETANLLTITFY